MRKQQADKAASAGGGGAPRRRGRASPKGRGNPEALGPPGDARTLYIVDLSGYVFRAYYAPGLALSTSKGETTHAVYVVTTMLLKLIKERNPRYLVVAKDAPGVSFRHELFPEYKATRKEHPEDLYAQAARLDTVVAAQGIASFAQPGVEADDIIATVTKHAREAGLKVVIVSADKDLLQLVDDSTLMYDTMHDRVFDAEATRAKMGVVPSKVRDLLALQGDASDNIPGVPSVGPKTAASLLDEHGDIDGIYAHLDQISRKALKEKLTAHRDQAYLSRELVTLKQDLPLQIDLEALEYRGPADEQQRRQLFIELEFTKLLAQQQPQGAPPVKTARVNGLAEFEALLQRARATQAESSAKFAYYLAVDEDDAAHGALVGIAVCVDGQVGHYLSLTEAPGVTGEPPPTADAALSALASVLNMNALRKCSASLKRDLLVLSRYGQTIVGDVFDVMLASYLLDPEKHNHSLLEVARSELQLDLLGYDEATDKQRGSQKALFDVEVSRGEEFSAPRAVALWRARDKLEARISGEGMQGLFEELELPLARVLAQLERTGIRLDVGVLRTVGEGVESELATLEQQCHKLAGHAFNVASPRQLETVLFDELGLPSTKRTKTARSTDHEVLEDLSVQHELPKTILEHRSLAKLKSTYLDALPRQVDRATGRIHTRYNQAVTATGRLSSSEPNLQNIPIRTALGRKLRDAFVPRDGWEILAADYSQIELRVLAHLSADPELVDAFNTSTDVHVRTAQALFGVPAADVTREMRGRAKTVNFAVIYGQTQFALARNLRIDRSEAKATIDAFFVQYAGVKAFLDETVEAARRTGEVRTILGRLRRLSDIRSRNHNLRAAAERIAKNTPIQGSAADILKRAMVEIAREMDEQGLESRMLLTVHDELVFEVAPAEKAAMEQLVRDGMCGAYELSVPLVVDVGWGRSWGEAH